MSEVGENGEFWGRLRTFFGNGKWEVLQRDMKRG